MNSEDLSRRMLPSQLEGDFSIVIGGPLFQALRRAHLTGDALELTRRRVVVVATIVWVPLLMLSAVDGRAWGSAVGVPFLYDTETHARFLVALPLLIFAELVVHRRMREVVGQFVSLGLMRDAVRERFDGAIISAMRLRNSVFAELLLIAAVYGGAFSSSGAFTARSGRRLGMRRRTTAR